MAEPGTPLPGASPLPAAINDAMRRLPNCCMMYVGVTRTLIFGAGSLACGFIGVPMELAMGFAVTRPLKRVRLPLDILGAVSMSRVFPQLREIEISRLFTSQMPENIEFRNPLEKYPKLNELWQKSGDLIDEYGAAYFIARDIVGLITVAAASFVFTFDVFSSTAAWLLHWTGITQSGASALSAMAGGACIATMSSPVLLATLPQGAQAIDRYIDVEGIMQKNMKNLERDVEKLKEVRAKQQQAKQQGEDGHMSAKRQAQAGEGPPPSGGNSSGSASGTP